jgi:hypothetical protein
VLPIAWPNINSIIWEMSPNWSTDSEPNCTIRTKAQFLSFYAIAAHLFNDLFMLFCFRVCFVSNTTTNTTQSLKNLTQNSKIWRTSSFKIKVYKEITLTLLKAWVTSKATLTHILIVNILVLCSILLFYYIKYLNRFTVQVV